MRVKTTKWSQIKTLAHTPRNLNIPHFLPEASFGLRVLSLPASVYVCVCLCVNHLLCPRDNWRPVQARITKFGPKMQNTLVKVPVVLWSDRPWHSRSNVTWNPNPILDQRCKMPWLRYLVFFVFSWRGVSNLVKFDFKAKFSGFTTIGNT